MVVRAIGTLSTFPGYTLAGMLHHGVPTTDKGPEQHLRRTDGGKRRHDNGKDGLVELHFSGLCGSGR